MEHLKSKALKHLKINETYYYLYSKAGFTDEIIKLAEKDKYLKLIGLDEIEKAFN